MKTFLSQTKLSWSWALKHGLGDPYQLHQWIWDALPNDPEAKRDFLFRSDVSNGQLKVLLLAARIPLSNAGVVWETTEVSSTFLGHGTYQFRLRANPTFRRSSDHRRLAIFDEGKVRAWFTRKLTDAGCDIQSLKTSAPRRIQFLKGGDMRPGILSAVDATGVLVVRNEVAFRAAFDAGFGPAKGFGFGLLLLQPIQI